jgi:head-tail adaptor
VSFRAPVHTVTVLNPTTTEDRYHNDVDDWATPATATERAWITQATSDEDLVGRDATIERWQGFFMPRSTITARSRVQWDGRTFEVDGTPKKCTSPRRRGVHHIEVYLRIVEG